MPIKKTTEKKIKEMVEAMTYHCKELAEFMQENEDDDFFKTDRGRKIKSHLALMLGGHAMAMVETLFPTLTKEDESKKETLNDKLETLDIEEMLKRML